MSGIYIPGMEMPHRHEAITIYPDGTAHLSHLGLGLHISESKAVPVPEHGELIEREPILDVMRKERDRISETYGPNDEYVNCLNKYAISMVTSAKTIIPADQEKKNETISRQWVSRY